LISDGYSNEVQGKMQGTEAAAIAYMKKLSNEAARYGMSTGLKNAQAIIPGVIDYIKFAVNEQCGARHECDTYNPLIAAKKPVFQIEYAVPTSKSGKDIRIDPQGFGSDEQQDYKKWAAMSSTDVIKALCLNTNTNPENGFSTVIKTMGLDGYTLDCDDHVHRTTTVEGSEPVKGGRDSSCGGHLG
jgi:hypothetical protein